MNETTISAQPGTPFIDIVREFDATPAQVYRAWTDPELIPHWLGPSGTTADVIEYDVTPGGRYRYVHRDDQGEHGFRGVFHTVVVNERIVQTFQYEGWPNEVSLETLTFEDLGGRTRVHTHSVFASVESRDGMIASGMEHGVRDSMSRLDKVLASPMTGQVIVDITMSLDGYVTAAGADAEHGLGVGGEPLHEWVFNDAPLNRKVLDDIDGVSAQHHHSTGRGGAGIVTERRRNPLPFITIECGSA